jgi:transcription initiation factor TFIIIB Brf1 subunit/transcription initiation factor TFIIB
MADQEASIAAAINGLSTGIYTSYRKAAKAYNVPKSTLRNRMKGATNHAISHQNQQRLSPQQEEFLAN